MMIPHFRDLMGTKPSLTIEVDTHTADAGVNTRIEAFMDVINNYRLVHTNTRHPQDLPFRQAKAEIDSRGRAWFIDSDGNRSPMTDPSIKVVIPSMGEYFNSAGAAALRAEGWNAHPLPVCDREALDLGRSVTTSKECLPIINIVGELLKYLKYRENPQEKLAFFLVSAGGCCRVGQYHILTKTLIDKLQLRNVAVITLSNDNGYAGLGINFRLNIAKLVLAADVFDDIRSAIKVLAQSKQEGLKVLEQEWELVLEALMEGIKLHFGSTSYYREKLAQLPRKYSINEAKFVGLSVKFLFDETIFPSWGFQTNLLTKVLLCSTRLSWNGFFM